MRISITGIISLLMLAMGITDGYSQDSSRCQAYWQERNAILKEYGYCFKSPRTIQYFGNGGCTYQRIDDIPFSKLHLDRMLEIRAMERSLRCGPRLTFSR